MFRPIEDLSQVTIPLPSNEEAGRIMGKGYDPGMTLNVIKMMAGREDMYAPTVAFIKAMFQAEGIDPRTREMIMLWAAKALNSPYEWQANVILGKNAGLTDSEIEAAASDGQVTGINPDYVLACKATDELSHSATLMDDTLSELLNRYDKAVCRKLILIISWFNLLGRFLDGCRVPLETSDKLGNATSPLNNK